MPFQSVPNTVEIIVRYLAAGQEIINTFYGQMDGYALADVESLAAIVDGIVDTDFKPLIAAGVDYVNTTVRGLNAAIDIEAVNADHAGACSLAGTTLPNNCSLAIKRASGFTGRGARGRIYWPPMTSGVLEVGGDTIAAATTEAIVAALDALDAAVNTAGFVPVIVHRVAAGVPLVPAAVFTLLEWVVVDRVIDSMRRRLPGRGV